MRWFRDVGEPLEGANSLALSLTWACRARDGCLVLCSQFRRAELSADADARPFAKANIPNGFAVPCDLPMQVCWARAGHMLLAGLFRGTARGDLRIESAD